MSDAAGQSDTTDRWAVQLVIPAATRFLHLVRLTAAGAAAEAGLDAEEVEDVKIAVDELCSITIAASVPHDVLTIDFVADRGRLRIVATAPGAGAMAVDEMGQAILGATVDTFDLDAGGRGGFQLTKSRRG